MATPTKQYQESLDRLAMKAMRNLDETSRSVGCELDAENSANEMLHGIGSDLSVWSVESAPGQFTGHVNYECKIESYGLTEQSQRLHGTTLTLRVDADRFLVGAWIRG